MKITLTASTAANIVVWKEDDLYHARPGDTTEHPQVCLAVDLFEVIAELAGLNLEHPDQAAEATSLAKSAQARLSEPRANFAAEDGPLSDPERDESPAKGRSAP